MRRSSLWLCRSRAGPSVEGEAPNNNDGHNGNAASNLPLAGQLREDAEDFAERTPARTSERQPMKHARHGDGQPPPSSSRAPTAWQILLGAALALFTVAGRRR